MDIELGILVNKKHKREILPGSKADLLRKQRLANRKIKLAEEAKPKAPKKKIIDRIGDANRRKRKKGVRAINSLMGYTLLARGKVTSQSAKDVTRNMQKQTGVSLWKGFTTNSTTIPFLRDALETLARSKQKLPAKKRRLPNIFQAAVRNRILDRDLGFNSKKRAKQKKFNLLFVATGQVFENLKARIRRIYKKRVK